MVRAVRDVQVRVDETVARHEEFGGVVIEVGVPTRHFACLGIDGVQPDGQAEDDEEP
jgi:hypothetical protein